jgi:hypothetical protein
MPAVSLLHRPWVRSGGIRHGIDFFVFQDREGDDQAVSRESPLRNFCLVLSKCNRLLCYLTFVNDLRMLDWNIFSIPLDWKSERLVGVLSLVSRMTLGK